MNTTDRIYGNSHSKPGKSLNSRVIAYCLFAAVIILIASCSKSKSTPDLIFKATLNGASETPSNASTATGDATLTFNQTTKIFTIVVNFTGITATAAHIHKGAVGVAGGVIFGFPSPIVSPINYTSAALDSTQVADLKSDMYYVNVHSEAYPAGEIRGQLVQQ